MSTVKLKRLKIDQYRNVKPGTELHFDDGVNLVLGQNGSGKTTLLGLLSMVCGWYFEELENEEFAFEFDVKLDAKVFTFTLNNRKTSTQSGNESLSYEFQLSFGDSAVRLHGTPSSLITIEGDSETKTVPCSPFKYSFLRRLEGAVMQEAARRMFVVGGAPPQYAGYLHELGSGPPYRFDEGLSCFYALTGEAAPSATPAGLTSASIGASLTLDLTKTPSRIFTNTQQSPFSTSLKVLRQVFAGAGPDWAPFDTVASDEVGFLRDTVAQLGFASATLRPVASSASGPPDQRKIVMAGFDFGFTRQDGTWLPHTLLSYGQKRLLAYYYYLANNDAFIIADELVNGLHHRWIKACMDAIGERQAFLTSQNPLLFDYVEFDSIEQVEARFITCKSELVDGAEQLVWQNMPRDDAARFYEAYTDEIQQVGEILITRGLW